MGLRVAYDLILRRQITRNFSREESASPLAAEPEREGLKAVALLSLGLLGAVAWSLPKIGRVREKRYYRRTFAADDLRITREMPAISMKDLMYGGR
jgi:hypothetical protein